MPLPLTVSCFTKIQIGFTFLVPAHPGSPGKRAVKRVCVCVCNTFLKIVTNFCHNISQDSVKTCLRCGKIFKHDYTANLVLYLIVKEL